MQTYFFSFKYGWVLHAFQSETTHWSFREFHVIFTLRSMKYHLAIKISQTREGMMAYFRRLLKKSRKNLQTFF